MSATVAQASEAAVVLIGSISLEIIAQRGHPKFPLHHDTRALRHPDYPL
jgi:hypothetical protein